MTRRRGFAIGLSILLVATLADLVVGSQTAIAAAPQRPACPQSQPDEHSASIAATSCRGKVEILSARTEKTRLFAEPDRSRTAEVHTGVVRVRDGRGGWQDVDLNLERRLDGSVAPRVHPNGLILAGATGPGEHDLAALGSKDAKMILGWRGALAEPVLDGRRATYVDAKPGVDLIVEVTRSGFETFLVVKHRAAAAQVASVAMPWRKGRLSERSTAGGGLELRDTAGRLAGQVDGAFMWDSRVDPASGLPTKQVTVGLATRPVGAGRTDLVLTPDQNFLADPETSYPVTIDPQWNIWTNQDTWVESDFPWSTQGWNSTELKLGTYNGGGVVARSFLSFDVSPYYGTYINWATLHLYETWAYSCRDAEFQMWSTGWFDHTTYWNNQPVWLAYHSSSWETTGYDACEPNGWVNIDARGFFQNAADSWYPYWGMGLRAGLEWHSDSWKRFHSTNGANDPYVTINFNYPPTVAAVATTPSTPCVTGASRPHLSTIPQLQAQVADPEGASVWAKYEWWVTGGSLIGSTTTGPAGSWSWQPAAVIPPGDLPDGGTYSWRVQGSDGLRWGPWSGWCEFTLDTQAPSALATNLPSPCVSTTSGGDVASLPRLNPNNAGAGLALKAKVNDVNGGTTRAQFEWWPKATKGSSGMIGTVTTSPPAAVGSTFSTTIEAGTFTDGQAYSWRVRGHDGGIVKVWSPWCEFVVDTTVPGAPTVSADPGNDLLLAVAPTIPGPPPATAVVGRPTQVSLHPAGGTDTNIVAYLWGVNTASPDRWAPAGPDGTAVVSIEALVGGFSVNQLTVLAVDRAGNRSSLPGAGYSYGFKANAAAGWWPTTASSGPIADLAGGAELGLTGGASLAAGVLTLDGSSADATTTGPVLDTTDSFTVSAWARLTDLSDYNSVLAQDGTSESAFRLMFRPAVNAWCFGMTESDTPATPIQFACAAGPPQAGAWNHLVGVHDAGSGELRLYVDGTLAATTSFSSAWLAEGPFTVGRAQKSAVPVYHFAGDIADVRAWQAVMDPTGIAAMATLPPAAGAWGMDNPGGAQAADTAGLDATHDASLTGGAGWASGHSGDALHLDGTTGMGMTAGPVVRTDESFTVAAWVRLDAKGSHSRIVAAQAGANLSAFYLGWDSGSDRWCFSMPTPDTSGTATWQYVLSPTSPPTGTWVHLAGVYNKSTATIRLYVNGALQGTQNGVSTWNAGAPLRIGDGMDNGLTRLWAGDIDDVRIFRGGLSGAQITYLATH